MASVNEDIQDGLTSHAIGLSRRATAIVAQIVAVLDGYDDDLVAAIYKRDPNAVSPGWAAQRLDALLLELRAINREAYRVVLRALREELEELAAYEAEYQAALLLAALPMAWTLTMPTVAMLRASVNAKPFLGALLKEWVAGLEDGRAQRLRNAVRIGFTEDESAAQVVRRVVGTPALNYRDGVLETSRRSAESTIRTAVGHTTTQARGDLYNGNADLIAGWRFVAVLDQRTTPTCRALDGSVHPLGEGPLPPRHRNCRSFTVPVVRSGRALGVRGQPDLDGQPAEHVTYQTWLSRRSAAFQDDVLGPTRGRLFRAGELELTRFVDATGRAYTLDQLRRREREAFTQAGL